MTFRKIIILTCLVNVLILFSCSEPNICADLFSYYDSTGCLELQKSIQWDSIIIMPSHTYPSDLASTLDLDYDFKVTSDPVITLITVKGKTVVEELCGRCSGYTFSNSLEKYGFTIFKKSDCLKVVRSDKSYTFIDRLE